MGLSVSAQSDLPVAFQWFFNDVPVPGATNSELVTLNVQRSTLNLVNVQPTNAGMYRVRLESADTSVTSIPAGVVLTNGLPVPVVVSVSQAGGAAVVTFSTVVGLGYVLEYKERLEEVAWRALGTPGSFEGTGGNGSLTDAAAGGVGRFYRVRAE